MHLFVTWCVRHRSAIVAKINWHRPPSNRVPSFLTMSCFLLYESDSTGKLMLHFSKEDVPNAIGRFVPGEGKKIQARCRYISFRPKNAI